LALISVRTIWKFPSAKLLGNLTDWEPIEVNVVAGHGIHFVDPEAPESPARYYRVVPLPDVEWFSED